jgi:hypothetical protein
MKKTLIVITLFLVIGSLSAQDKIYFNDGSTIEAKVLFVTESKVQYKNFDNQSGPTFEIGLSKINMIIYENDTHQIFNKQGDEATMTKINKGFQKTRLGVGFQANFPAVGLSVKVDLAEHHSAQAVIGIFGPFSSYYGRYLYNFSESGENFLVKPYLFVQAGLWKNNIQSYGFAGYDYSGSSSFGYGIGAGLEFTYPKFTDKLKYSIEIAYSEVDLYSYNFNSITFGVGLHYYFNL